MYSSFILLFVLSSLGVHANLQLGACSSLSGQTWDLSDIGIIVNFFDDVISYTAAPSYGDIVYGYFTQYLGDGQFNFDGGSDYSCGVTRSGTLYLFCYNGIAYSRIDEPHSCHYGIRVSNISLCNGCGSGSLPPSLSPTPTVDPTSAFSPSANPTAKATVASTTIASNPIFASLSPTISPTPTVDPTSAFSPSANPTAKATVASTTIASNPIFAGLAYPFFVGAFIACIAYCLRRNSVHRSSVQYDGLKTITTSKVYCNE